MAKKITQTLTKIMALLKDLLNSFNKPASLFIVTDDKGQFKDYAFGKKGEPLQQSLYSFVSDQLAQSRQEGFIGDFSIHTFDLKKVPLPFNVEKAGTNFAKGLHLSAQKGKFTPEYAFQLRDAAFALSKNLDLSKIDDLSVLSNGLLKNYADYEQFQFKQKQLSNLYKDNLCFVVETSPGNSFIISRNENGKQELRQFMQDLADRYFTDKNMPDYLKITPVRYDEAVNTVYPDSENPVSKFYTLNPNPADFNRFTEDFSLRTSPKNDTILKLLYMENSGYDRDFVRFLPDQYKESFKNLELELYEISGSPYYRELKNQTEEKGKIIASGILNNKFDIRDRFNLRKILLDDNQKITIGGRDLNKDEKIYLYNGGILFLNNLETKTGDKTSVYIWHDRYSDQLQNSFEKPSFKENLRQKNEHNRPDRKQNTISKHSRRGKSI